MKFIRLYLWGLAGGAAMLALVLAAYADMTHGHWEWVPDADSIDQTKMDRG